MKVKDIIKGSIWRPGKLYDPKVKPAISVLLPTFRRGKSGLFRRAVESVLDQTLEDIELIIIDDASTDGTADQIREFMKEDGRVSAIIHPRNIGLPAISEYEGYMRARADYIGFAFDDDFFYPDALEQLLEHSLNNPGKVCYGHVSMRIREHGSTVDHFHRLGHNMSLTNLRSANVIANNAVLLPRHVIEDVGFYDPRVVMTRQCDWDLWRRIGNKYLLHYVDIAIGEVDGPATEDSLGKTYLLDAWASEALIRSDRSNALRPDALGQLDIEAMPECDTDLLSHSTYRELVANHVAYRPWLRESPTPLPTNKLGDSVLVLTASHEASTSLYFDYLPKTVNSKVRVIHPETFGITELARASCLIIVRSIEIYSEWLKAAKLLGIPIYYFLDDNIPELVAQEDFRPPEDMSRRALRDRLRTFDGVLLSSESLLQYFEAHLIHPKLFYFPPCYAGAPLEKGDSSEKGRATRSRQKAAVKHPKHQARTANPEACGSAFAVTVAFAGGGHRQAGLLDIVMPALKRLTETGLTIHVVVAGCSGDAEDNLRKFSSENLKLDCLPFEIDWKRVLLQLAQCRPDLLIHAPSSTVNNRYKTLNAALNAHLLNAVLVAPDQAPFDDPEFSGAAIRVAPPERAKAWLEAIAQLLRDRKSWSWHKDANAKYCGRHFSGEKNTSVLQALLAASPPVGFATVESRLKLLYWAKGHGTIARATPSSDLDTLGTSLSELARMRQSHRRYRSLRFQAKRDDLWSSLSPAFAEISDYVVKHNIRRRNMTLELSDSLHERPYAEYRISLPARTLNSISCAFASEGIHSGLLGLEIVSPEGEIVLHNVLDLSGLNLHAPVRFDALGLKIPRAAAFALRFFARSDWPVYILEFASYDRFGLRRHTAAPFARFDYAGAF
jgi:glycosyltransferase involved in cell wall biosynthesis